MGGRDGMFSLTVTYFHRAAAGRGRGKSTDELFPLYFQQALSPSEYVPLEFPVFGSKMTV